MNKDGFEGRMTNEPGGHHPLIQEQTNKMEVSKHQPARQGYVEKARCAMCPVWRGLTLRFEGPTLRLASTGPASASPASGRGLPGTLVVEALQAAHGCCWETFETLLLIVV